MGHSGEPQLFSLLIIPEILSSLSLQIKRLAESVSSWFMILLFEHIAMMSKRTKLYLTCHSLLGVAVAI